MPIVPYNASNFGKHWGKELIGLHNLDLTWSDIVWAAMTVGKPGIAFLLTHGWHSISDIIVKTHTIYAHLLERDNFIEKSFLYEELDPSEKGGISYFMGMMAAKVVADRLLNTPWLFHLSMLRMLNGDYEVRSRSEPDLIGLNKKRDWIVVETKGRSRRYCNEAMVTAKQQTRQLRSVNGQFPTLRVAVQAYFDPTLSLAIDDPDEYDKDAEDLDFDLEAAIEMYYSGPLRFIGKSRKLTLDGRTFSVRKIPEIGVTIGLADDWRDLLPSVGNIEVSQNLVEKPLVNQFTDVRNKNDTPKPAFVETPKSKDTFKVYSDGLAISLDKRWSSDLMCVEPWFRRDRKK